MAIRSTGKKVLQLIDKQHLIEYNREILKHPIKSL